MSSSWVPPGRTSPYQNGAGALENPAAVSLNELVRQAAIGDDASLVPRRNRQTELVEKTSVPRTRDGAIRQRAIAKRIVRRRIRGVPTPGPADCEPNFVMTKALPYRCVTSG